MQRVEAKPGYESLARVLDMALEQAQSGKGKERHAYGDEAFEEQQICSGCRRHGLGYATGQAEKKGAEGHRLPGERRIREWLGAINYLAAAVIMAEEELARQADEDTDELFRHPGLPATTPR